MATANFIKLHLNMNFYPLACAYSLFSRSMLNIDRLKSWSAMWGKIVVENLYSSQNSPDFCFQHVSENLKLPDQSDSFF